MKLTLLLFFLCMGIGFAQNQTCKVIFFIDRQGTLQEVVSQRGILKYNYTTGYFRLDLDLATVSTEDRYLDSLFSAIPNKQMIFEGNTHVNFTRFQDEEKFYGEEFQLAGLLTINGTTRSVNTRYTPLDQFKLYKDVRIDWTFTINPKDFNLKMFDPIHKIEILIPQGYLNRM